MMSKMSIYAVCLLTATFLFAETKVEVYKIPLGSYLKIQNEENFEVLEESLKKTEPAFSYREKSKDRMIQYKDIKVFLRNSDNKKENYNKMLEIVSEFSKEVDGLDQDIVTKTLKRLKAEL